MPPVGIGGVTCAKVRRGRGGGPGSSDRHSSCYAHARLARSTYYDEPELQPLGEARLVEQIKAVCAEWPAYGYRRVTAELHDEGRIVNHKRVMRLMKENGLTVRPRRLAGRGAAHHET